VQKRIRTEVCLVLKTRDEGCGKGQRERIYAHLLGTHAMQVHNPAHVVGKFNPHLQTLLRLTADEALFVGNHEHRNALFNLTTESKITIEPKFLGVSVVDNYLNITLTTNSDHVIPASATARRFFMPTFSQERRKDFEYFGAMFDQLEHGGYEALLWHLLHEVDLTGFNVRDVPMTAGLMEQAAYTRHGIDALVEDACSAGVAPCGHSYWPGFTCSAGEYGFDDLINRSADRELKTLGARRAKLKLKNEWGCVIGELAARHEKGSNLKVYGIAWPALDVLRAAFIKRHGETIWESPNVTEWQLPARDLPKAIEGGRPGSAAQGELPGTRGAGDDIPF
jgi:hypothetical protein